MRMLALTVGTLLLLSSAQAFAGGDPTADSGKPAATRTSPVKHKRHHKPKSVAPPQVK